MIRYKENISFYRLSLYICHMDVLSRSENETAETAATLAASLHPGDFLALHGDLGAGKTVFARSLIRTLTGNPMQEVPSPTFTLVQIYENGKAPLWHFDFYRIKDPEEIFELGWEEALAGGIVLVEWPERAKTLLPPERLDIHIEAVDNKPEHRRIRIEKSGNHGPS